MKSKKVNKLKIKQKIYIYIYIYIYIFKCHVAHQDNSLLSHLVCVCVCSCARVRVFDSRFRFYEKIHVVLKKK